MTPTEIRIAVAEELGWYCDEDGFWMHDDDNTRLRICKNRLHGCCPDYPEDLNACHEMEKSLKTKEDCDEYVNKLIFISAHINPVQSEFGNHMFMFCNAPALQRCEAFLRVKGKWKE